ncbi:hypothetical protein ACHWQZ_G004724 [Mnemiopsis leidyi]
MSESRKLITILLTLTIVSRLLSAENLQTVTQPSFLTTMETPTVNQDNFYTPSSGKLSCFSCSKNKEKHLETCISLENGCSNCTTTNFYKGDGSHLIIRDCNKPNRLAESYSTCVHLKEKDCKIQVCSSDMCNGGEDVQLSTMFIFGMIIYILL